MQPAVPPTSKAHASPRISLRMTTLLREIRVNPPKLQCLRSTGMVPGVVHSISDDVAGKLQLICKIRIFVENGTKRIPPHPWRPGVRIARAKCDFALFWEPAEREDAPCSLTAV